MLLSKATIKCTLLRCLVCLLPASFLFLCAQVPQQQYIDQLNRFTGNKLLLVGSWSAQERSEWNRLVENEDVFELNIRVIETTSWVAEMGTWGADLSGFEIWLGAEYSLGMSRWVMLDTSNQALTQGVAIPNIEDFSASLDMAGLISPVKQLRGFLTQYPDHLEARSDLLKQLRRRAVKLATQKMTTLDDFGYRSLHSSELPYSNVIKEQLNSEEDLAIWDPLAQEIDVLFRGNWQGIDIPFFRVEENSPLERHSHIMKAVFARHIGKVETAIQEVPTSQSLWNIWAWLAQGLENSDWIRLLNSLETFSYPGGLSFPAPNVAVWLAIESAAIEDWEKSVEMAKKGVNFLGYPGEAVTAWFPGGWVSDSTFDRLDGYPINSAFVPWLRGLLMLDRLEEANEVFENILFLAGEGIRGRMVDMAEKAGHNGMAEQWRTKLHDKSTPRLRDYYTLGKPTIVRYIPGGGGVPLSFKHIPLKVIWKEQAMDTFGWPESESRWALLDKDNRLIVEGEGNIQHELISEALERMGYRTRDELARIYLRENSSDSYAHYVLASELGEDAWQILDASNLDALEILDNGLDFGLWSECTQHWIAYYENELAVKCQIANNASSFGENSIYRATNSNLMRSVAGKIILELEKALRQLPTSEYLWNAWLSWWRVSDKDRSITSLLAELLPSPLASAASFPSAKVMDVYYNECVAQERWAEAAKLLRRPWERELAKIDTIIMKHGVTSSFHPQTWITGKLLISALLHDRRVVEAEEVIEEWTSRGGEFKGVSGIIELAKILGYNSLADKWEKR